jgi:hypothetical protein
MDIPIALSEVRPNEEFAMDDCTDYDTLIWHSDTKKPTQDEVAEGWNLHLKKQYQRDRAEAYPSVTDQLDDLYKAGAFGVDMAAKIKKVKDDNPKS